MSENISIKPVKTLYCDDLNTTMELTRRLSVHFMHARNLPILFEMLARETQKYDREDRKITENICYYREKIKIFEALMCAMHHFNPHTTLAQAFLNAADLLEMTMDQKKEFIRAADGFAVEKIHANSPALQNMSEDDFYTQFMRLSAAASTIIGIPPALKDAFEETAIYAQHLREACRRRHPELATRKKVYVYA